MPNHDRVNELYHGKIFTLEAQRVCRDRIHWMCGQIRGDTVLDIGCSQGIASILAAREGLDVVGVDVEEDAIEFARRDLANEAAAVRERVRFVNADIHAVDLDGRTFDTVLLGEILEHQTQPRRLFERACRFLAPSGLIVAATPFGLHVHHDHKYTFYLSDFLRTIEGLCTPASLEVVDGYIRFTAWHPEVSPTSMLEEAEQLLRRSETAFLAKEWRTHQVLTDRARRIKKLIEAESNVRTRVEELQGQIEALNRKLQDERARALRVTSSGLPASPKQPSADAGSATSTGRPAAPPVAGSGARATVSRQQEREAQIREPGAVRRGWGTLVASIRREVDSGRIRRDPVTAVQKTYARVRRSVRREPHPHQKASRAQSRTEPRAVDGARRPDEFPLYQPRIRAKRSMVTIATILDTFSHHCFQYEADLIPLSLEGWKREMEEHRPTLLFVESAWRGNGGQWKYLMTKYAQKKDNPLRDLLAWCKENDIPRVFWNKEDPANFDVFKEVAKDFDYVFTTDEQCVPRYRDLVGHDRVYSLPFAAQPAIHNPMRDDVKRTGRVCFAGSWRADKYPERAADTETLLRPAMQFGVDIFDRFAGTKDADKFAFPQPYRRAVRGSLEYDRMLSAYRAYDAFLNVNSVKQSPTMFSRRVFELMACATPVVSTDSSGIRDMLGSLVKIAENEDDARAHLRQLLDHPDYRERYAHAGYRDVLERHTYQERLSTILRTVGLDHDVPRAPLVTVLAATNRPERLFNLLDNVRRQVHTEVELLILLNSDRYDAQMVQRSARDLRDVSVYSLPESFTLADCLNHGIEHARGDFVAKLDDDDYYGPHYLSDLLLTTRYTDAEIIGKRSYFCYLEGGDTMAVRFPGHSHRHVKFVHGGTLLVRRGVFETVRFTPVRQGTDTIFQRECREAGMSIYSADPYNFVHVRHADAATHTWQIADEEFLTKCRVLRHGLDMGAVMI